MFRKRAQQFLQKHVIAIAGLSFLVVSVVLFAIGRGLDHEPYTDWSRAVSEAGVGLFAAAIITFAVEPLNHSQRTKAVAAILLAHEERLLRSQMTDLVFWEFK